MESCRIHHGVASIIKRDALRSTIDKDVKDTISEFQLALSQDVALTEVYHDLALFCNSMMIEAPESSMVQFHLKIL